MRFLKTLQKKQLEQPLDNDALDNRVPRRKIKRERINKPTAPFEIRDQQIGKLNSTFNNESDSLDEVFPFDKETESVDKAGPLATFGLIVINPERVNPRLVAITQPNSAYCEEYRSLRTHILHQSQKQKLQSIVVASVGPAEGKSVTALNLSWLLAQTDGIRTLIIDSDLRSPSLTEYLGIETKTGLSEVLENKSLLRDAIIRLEPAGLHLLPGGNSRHDVAELISGLKFKEILADVREMFDYVIIDAPPLGVFTDATVLINHSDGALFVVCANKTRYKDIERVLEMLPRERLLGAVLNQTEESFISDNSYYYNYYNKTRQS